MCICRVQYQCYCTNVECFKLLRSWLAFLFQKSDLNQTLCCQVFICKYSNPAQKFWSATEGIHLHTGFMTDIQMNPKQVITSCKGSFLPLIHFRKSNSNVF